MPIPGGFPLVEDLEQLLASGAEANHFAEAERVARSLARQVERRLLFMWRNIPKDNGRNRLSHPRFQPMFGFFQQSPFQPPQHGNGMRPPLAYAIDGILPGISIILALLFIAWAIVPLIIH